MADDPNLEPGRSFDIATDGIGSGRPITVATRGFIVPILGDLILGGEAGVVFETDVIQEYLYTGSGGLVLDGAAAIRRSLAYTATGGLVVDGTSLIARAYAQAGTGGLVTDGAAEFNGVYAYTASGGLTLGGEADVATEVVPVTGGQLVLGGGATFSRSYAYDATGGLVLGGDVFGIHRRNYDAAGGLVIDGSGLVNFSLTVNGDGGLVIDGQAGVDSTGKLLISRGGATNRPAWRWNQKPNITWEPADPQVELSPMDYLKRIQDRIKALEPKTFDYTAKGTLRVNGQGKVTVINRDMPDGPIVFADSAPLEPIQMDISSLFSQGNTAKEIAEFEDRLMLSDLLGQGRYHIKPGVKSRFIHRKTKGPKGAAAVSFTPAGAKTEHTDFVAELIKSEDEELVLGDDIRQEWDHEEELRLLGIID